MRAVAARQEATVTIYEMPDKRKKNLTISDAVLNRGAERLWNSNFGESENLNWTKAWASCPIFGVSPVSSRRFDWRPPEIHFTFALI